MGLKYLRKKNFIPILSLNAILSCLVYKKKYEIFCFEF